jgi:hypothetical protein
VGCKPSVKWDVRQDIDNHPTDQHELSLKDEDKSLKTIDSSDHGNGDNGDSRFPDSNDHNKIDQLSRYRRCQRDIDARGEQDSITHVNKGGGKDNGSAGTEIDISSAYGYPMSRLPKLTRADPRIRRIASRSNRNHTSQEY